MQRRSPSFYRKRRSKLLQQRYRVNRQIHAPRLLVIDENGKSLDEMDLAAALRLAEEKELDLVEVQPTLNPPICKILNYGQFQYTQEKLKQKLKNKQKKVETKGIRLTFRIGAHDRQTRLEQAQRFLAAGHKVNIDMVLKGREKAFSDEAKRAIEDFISEAGDSVQIEQPFSRQGGRLSILISKKQP